MEIEGDCEVGVLMLNCFRLDGQNGFLYMRTVAVPDRADSLCPSGPRMV
jgi:hypothetical protein